MDVQRILFYMSGMQPRLHFLQVALIAAILVGHLFALVQAQAAEYRGGAIAVDNPWLRATPKGASVAGGYMKITNRGAEPDRLIGGSATVAGRFEIHSMVMEQGVAKMRPVEGGLAVEAGKTIELRPGSFHVMLTDLKQPLEKGQKIKGTLEFEKAGKIEIEYAVEALGAGSPAGGRHGH